MQAHLSIPIFHTHAPYVERKDIRLQIRNSLVALVAALALTVATVAAWAAISPAASQTQARVIEWSTTPSGTSGLQYPKATRSYDFMYAPGAETRNVDYMYAKPRAQRFGR